MTDSENSEIIENNEYNEYEIIINEIKHIIINNNIIELNNYLYKNNIQSEDYNNFNEILIFCIENGISINLIQIILSRRKNKNLNIHITIDNEEKVPLFVAIGHNQFDISDVLIENNADINYCYEMNNHTYDIIDYLLKTNRINNKNLNYLLDMNCNRINFNLCYKLIKHFKFKCLKTHITYYALKQKYNCQTFGLYSKRDEELNLQKILEYNMVEKSIKTNDYNYIKKILSYHSLSYHYINYKEVLISAITKHMTPENINKKII